SIAYHPNGKEIACGLVKEKSVVVVEENSVSPGASDRSGVSFHSATDLRTLGLHMALREGEAGCIAYHPGGKVLAVEHAGLEGGSSVLLWDLARSQPLGAPLEVPAGAGVVTCLAFNREGDILAAGRDTGGDGDILLWEGNNWRNRKAAPITSEEPIYSL